MEGRRAETLRELHLAESSLAALRAENGKSALVRGLESRVAGLLEAEDAIEAKLSEEQSRQRTMDAAASAQTIGDCLPQIQRRLGAHTALLEYWTDTRNSYLWVVTASSVRWFVLPGAEVLRRQVAELTDNLLEPFESRPASVEEFCGEAIGIGGAVQRHRGAGGARADSAGRDCALGHAAADRGRRPASVGAL